MRESAIEERKTFFLVTRDAAEAAAKAIVVKYTNEQAVITTAEQATKRSSFYMKLPDLTRGDAMDAISKAPMKVSGELTVGAQTHFHMETMVQFFMPQI